MKYQIISSLLFLSTLVRADNCTVADAQALGTINQAAMQACMGSSTSISKLESCFKSSGVTLSSGCLSCLSTVASSAQSCSTACSADPSGQACTNCVNSLSNSALQCFGSDVVLSTPNPSGQSISASTTPKGVTAVFTISTTLLLLLSA